VPQPHAGLGCGGVPAASFAVVEPSCAAPSCDASEAASRDELASIAALASELASCAPPSIVALEASMLAASTVDASTLAASTVAASTPASGACVHIMFAAQYGAAALVQSLD
jgi:hypothetical protein